ncbi:MAG: hypothetical protein RR921_05310, partial [Mucinivorans sp.]
SVPMTRQQKTAQKGKSKTNVSLLLINEKLLKPKGSKKHSFHDPLIVKNKNYLGSVNIQAAVG